MSVGETLSRTRRSMGLSLDDVSAETRIRSSLVASIENDDFGPCGGAVYARGHIRSIARVLNLDAGPLVKEFDAGHQVELPPVAATVAPQATDPDLISRSDRRRPNWTAAMVVALAVICVFALVGLLNHNGGKSPKHQTAQAPATVQTESPTSSPPPTTVAEVPVTKATMLVRANDTCWLQVTRRNGRVLFSQNIYAGQSKLFTAKGGLSFIIGNAPAVDVVVNGHDLGSPRSEGSVARGNVTPGADSIQPA